MTLLFKIIRATHANGTHHKLALDALRDLEHPEADAWRRVFLRHADLFMEGAKAPDTVFKDFKNHVLHPGDNYWGGAPERVQHWYGVVVRELAASNWPEAVYAAGVLAHYFCDPIHPFHTAQSEAENNIHRAVEWSVSKSYDEIRAIGEASFWAERPEPGAGESWLADFVCRGAEKSHHYYEYLIAHYDFQKGVVDPPAGFDIRGQHILAELIMYAAGGLAAILDKAIAEAAVEPPAINLTVDTVLAGLKIPLKWVLKKMTDAEDRRTVEAMYDELMETGKVEANLSEDDRSVRALHAKEVIGARESDRITGRAVQLAHRAPIKPPLRTLSPGGSSTGNAAPQSSAKPVRATPPPVPAPVHGPVLAGAAIPHRSSAREFDATAGALAATIAAAQPAMTAQRAFLTGGERAAAQDNGNAGIDPPETLNEAVHKMRAALGRIATIEAEAGQTQTGNDPSAARLGLDDDVVEAPSIGPKTAARLAAVGVHTVRDLLDADPGALSEALDARHISARSVRDWQLQTHLVIDIAGLNGTDAQMLVGAGYTTADKVRNASTDDLHRAVKEFGKSAEGQRILRFGKAPDRERIDRWLSLAQSSRAAA